MRLQSSRRRFSRIPVGRLGCRVRWLDGHALNVCSLGGGYDAEMPDLMQMSQLPVRVRRAAAGMAGQQSHGKKNDTGSMRPNSFELRGVKGERLIKDLGNVCENRTCVAGLLLRCRPQRC